MSNILTLLFAPSFLIFIQYFEFKVVTFTYIFLSFLVLLYVYLKRKKAQDYIIISIYLLLLLSAYFMNSFEAVKLIPVLSAMAFFVMFVHATLQKSELIFKFTTQFYKKPLSESEKEFLKKGDMFWAVAIFLYTVLLASLVYIGDDAAWAFFSSIGWYIYFVITLAIQIIYGKVYAIKMSTK